MSNNTEQTRIAVELWEKQENRDQRYRMLDAMSKEAGIFEQFNMIPSLRIKHLDPEKFMIHVYAMAKIRELKRIADNKKSLVGPELY